MPSVRLLLGRAAQRQASPRRTQSAILVFECFIPSIGVLVDDFNRHNWSCFSFRFSTTVDSASTATAARASSPGPADYLWTLGTICVWERPSSPYRPCGSHAKTRHEYWELFLCRTIGKGGGSASIEPRDAKQAHLPGDCDALKASTLRARPSTHVTRLLLQYNASCIRGSASYGGHNHPEITPFVHRVRLIQR